MPVVHGGLERGRGLGAARYLAGRLVMARARAVNRSTTVALYFDEGTTDVTLSTVEDGNGNGVLAREIALGVDSVVEAALRLSDLYRGVRIARAPDMPAGDAIQLSGTSILSFSPTGTSSSGSVYLLGPDGTQWVVRVLGVTARVQVLRRVAGTGEWVHAF